MSSKFALITGANRGLGFECVKTILRQTDPYHVLLCSRSVAAGEKAVASLPSSLSAPSRVSVIELDVTSPASITAAVASVKSLAPSLSVLVNNAGILEGEQTLSTNFDAVLAVTQAFMPLLADGSCITTTSSSCGTRFLASLPPQDASELFSSELTVPELSAKITELSNKPDVDIYSLSKCAVNCYTRILARAHPELHITAVSPGFTNTGMCANYTGTRQPKEVALGATVFHEALFGLGKGRSGIFLKQNSSAGTELKDAETIETAWST